METSKRARKSANGSMVKEDIPMDAGIWGRLQEHIPLQSVYEKLPYEELFRLRLICKAWHHAALQRLEPKPYFVIIAYGGGDGCGETYLNGVLSYNVASQEYSFRRQRFPINYLGLTPFEVEGLIFCQHPENEQPGVFSIHTKMWHAIPPIPEKSKYRAAIGMIVDKSERPYSFKLVVGSFDTETQIYDSHSRSWSTTSSRLKRLAKPALSNRQIVTCMSSNGCVYLSIGSEMLLMYSIRGDNWTVMDFPEVKQKEDGGGSVHALGEWEGRIFTTRENCRKRNITLWELVDPAKEEWAKTTIISGEGYDYFMECDFSNYGPSVYENLRVVPCFCDGYLLIYNWHYSNCQSYALGMVNLATSSWESVDLPPRTVAIEINDIEEDSDMEGNSDNEGIDAECFEEYKYHGVSYGRGSDCDEDEEDEDTESDASDPGCAAIATPVRRIKAGGSEAILQQQKRADAVCSEIAHGRRIGGHEVQLVVNQESGAPLQSDEPAVTSGGVSVGLAEKLSPPVGNTIINPTPAAILHVDWRKSSSSSWMEATMHNLASRTEESTIERFKCHVCLFRSNALHDYELHMKTKVHRVVEVLHRERDERFPIKLLNDYVASKQQKVNYETESRIAPHTPYKATAVVEGTVDGITGLPIKGFGFSYTKMRRAEHTAAAAALERIVENVPLDEFINLARQSRPVKETSGKKHENKDEPNCQDITRGNTGDVGSTRAVVHSGGIGSSSVTGVGADCGVGRSHPESSDRKRGRYGGRRGGRGYCDRRGLPATLAYGGRGFHPGI